LPKRWIEHGVINHLSFNRRLYKRTQKFNFWSRIGRMLGQILLGLQEALRAEYPEVISSSFTVQLKSLVTGEVLF